MANVIVWSSHRLLRETTLVLGSCRRRLAPLLSPPNAALAGTCRRTRAGKARSGILDPLLLVFARGSLSGQTVTRPDDGSPWLFLSRKGVPLNRSSLHQRISRLARQAGLEKGGVHRLRHAFAINAIRNGASVLDVKHCLGHSRLDTTQRYVSSFGYEDAGRNHARFSSADNLLARGRMKASGGMG